MENTAAGAKLWFITGASRGLGLALTRAAWAAGDRVVVTTRDGRLPEVGAAGGRIAGYALEVGDESACARVAERALAEHGAPDLVVNNAGAARLAPVETGDATLWRDAFAVNLFGPLALTRAFLPALMARGAGRFVFLGAAAGVGNYPGFAAYGAAKAALEAASESLRAEVAPRGLGVTLVWPGPFRTHFAARALADSPPVPPAYERTVGRFARLLASLDGKQPGDPEQAAAALVGCARAGVWPDRLALGAYMAKKLTERATLLHAAAAAAPACAYGAVAAR